MTHDDVLRLLQSLRAAFPATRPLADGTAATWANALANTDVDVAADALAIIRSEDEFFPSIARFHGACRSVRASRGETTLGPGSQPITQPVPSGPCGSCDDTGWVVADPIFQTVMVNGEAKPMECTAVRPCRVCRPEAFEKQTKLAARARRIEESRVNEGTLLPYRLSDQIAKVRAAMTEKAST